MLRVRAGVPATDGLAGHLEHDHPAVVGPAQHLQVEAVCFGSVCLWPAGNPPGVSESRSHHQRGVDGLRARGPRAQAGRFLGCDVTQLGLDGRRAKHRGGEGGLVEAVGQAGPQRDESGGRDGCVRKLRRGLEGVERGLQRGHDPSESSPAAPIRQGQRQVLQPEEAKGPGVLDGLLQDRLQTGAGGRERGDGRRSANRGRSVKDPRVGHEERGVPPAPAGVRRPQGGAERPTTAIHRVVHGLAGVERGVEAATEEHRRVGREGQLRTHARRRPRAGEASPRRIEGALRLRRTVADIEHHQVGS